MDVMSVLRLLDILFSMAVKDRSAPSKALNTRFGAWGTGMNLYGRMAYGL